MKQIVVNLVLASCFAMPLSGMATDMAVDPKLHEAVGEQVSDAHREMQVLTALDRNPSLHAFDFSVGVEVGTVVLGGTVDNGINKDLAGRIALGVDGIEVVVNHIIVDAGYMRSQHESEPQRR